MILLADSGSTKTTWAAVTENSSATEICETGGINPFLQDSTEIETTIKDAFTLPKGPYSSIFFYGAGCANPEKNEVVRIPLASCFNAGTINIDSDLMAAARALCGKSAGIAAILGTGSNSCYYDGIKINRHVSPLGYILGDEGSGTVLGRKLLSDLLKNQLPESLSSAFYNRYRLDASEILDRVYRKPFPNRFMAQFTRFIGDHLEHPLIYKLVKDSFTEFIERNIRQYPEADSMPVNVTGSIGWYFREIFNEAAGEAGLKTGQFLKSPIEGLIKFHSDNTK